MANTLALLYPVLLLLAAVSATLGGKDGGQLGGRLGGQLGGRLGGQLGGRLGDQLGGRLDGQHGGKLGGQHGGQNGSQTHWVGIAQQSEVAAANSAVVDGEAETPEHHHLSPRHHYDHQVPVVPHVQHKGTSHGSPPRQNRVGNGMDGEKGGTREEHFGEEPQNSRNSPAKFVDNERTVIHVPEFLSDDEWNRKLQQMIRDQEVDKEAAMKLEHHHSPDAAAAEVSKNGEWKKQNVADVNAETGTSERRT